jgi:serine protease AprX
VSARPRTAGASPTSLLNPINVDFTRVEGTSSATAYVAGVIALILQKNPTLTPVEVKRILMETAIDFVADMQEAGAGCVDAAAAVHSTPLPHGGQS